MDSRKITEQELEDDIKTDIIDIAGHINGEGLHVPLGGTANQVVGKDSAGNVTWLVKSDSTIDDASEVLLPVPHTGFVADNTYTALQELLAKIQAEVLAKQTADATISGRIDNLVSDAQLQNDLNAERTARIQGDNNFLALLNQEIGTRTNADIAYNVSVDTEQAGYAQAQANIVAGKQKVADAIMQKGGIAFGTYTYQQLADALANIECGEVIPPVVSPFLKNHKVAAGGGISFILRDNGTIFACGSFDNNLISGITNAIGIAASQSGCLLVLKSDGTVVGYGYNANRLINSGIETAVGVAAGESHLLVLKSNGTVSAFGVDNLGEIRGIDGSIANAIGIAAGNYRSFIFRADGPMFACGQNYNSEISQLNAANITDAIDAAGGYNHCLVLKSNGTVQAFGKDSWGCVNGVNAANITNAIGIGAAYNYSVVLKSDGSITAWGYDEFGEIAAINASRETGVEIAADYSHCVVLRRDKKASAYGSDWGSGGVSGVSSYVP